jgi:hypothetical protein
LCTSAWLHNDTAVFTLLHWEKKVGRGRKATAKSLKPISMRYGSAFVQFTSNAAAVKGELRMYFQLKKKMGQRQS